MGFPIHNLSLGPDTPGQFLRAPGTYGQLIQKMSTGARVKLASGRHKTFPLTAIASIDQVEKPRPLTRGKAGRTRWLGKRPIVRGVAMNPVDHPHGGGEGKTSGGRPSCTPWGKPTKWGVGRSAKKT
ncbi:unnamed protein product [Chrysoparadoxa australica]